MMKTKRQQQTLQSSVHKRRQDRGGIGGIGNPDTKVVDSCLYHRPDDTQNDGCHCGIKDDNQRHETFSVEERKGIRQLAEVIIFVISIGSHKTGDNTHKHAHVQSRLS